VALIKPSASTRYTYDFVTANLPQGATRILEVGCGDGALAALLQADGLGVIAIDTDPEAVKAARAADVDARLISWPASMGAEFDAVLFTRSLHHVHALGEAVAAADRVLRPGGRIIVEDFRAEGGSESGTNWFADLVRSLMADGGLTAETSLDELVGKVAPDANEHELHSSSAIAEALGAFGEVAATDAAYYFRYLESHLRLPDNAQALLDQELSAMGSGAISPLGKRFVACAR
jgi:SAM-dependent methyltransferase